MSQDRQIGRIVKVQTYRALVDLQPDTTSYVKSCYGGLHSIAIINSFVIIPIGSERVIAMVVGLDMSEEPEATMQNRQMIVLPTSRRTMWVSMVGTIVENKDKDGKCFEYGIHRYPELDNPVWFASEEDLDIIFEKEEKKKRVLISIGTSPLFEDYQIKIDMDRFFGKHAAVLGNTGSGKSCTVTAIIKATLSQQNEADMPNAHFIIFDTNNEYESAFTENNSANRKYLYDRIIIRNDGDIPTGFWVPHWFMNGSDYSALFKPGEGAQAPLLHRAIGNARASHQTKSFRFHILDTISTTILSIRDIINNPPTGKSAFYGKQKIRTQVDQFLLFLNNNEPFFEELELKSSFTKYKDSFNHIKQLVITDERIDPMVDSTCRVELEKLENILVEDKKINIDIKIPPVGIDTPLYFDFKDFVSRVIQEEINRESDNSNIRNYVGTLLMRLEQASQDPRYSFLFSVNRFENSLASFLRLIFGVNPAKNFNVNKSKPPWADEYRKQYPEHKELHKITILDFSQLASDVLENMTALVGRLILEFLQKCPHRGKFPVVLVLEEAHHYIPAQTEIERQKRAREVFERIAKEGRKYGLSLLIASQRPSELSKTVLAQCNSFIVHRIQNPDDREYFKSVISGINRELLDQLPALPQQHALVIGDCITIPHQVKINSVYPKPDSHDPEFFNIWSDPDIELPNFEEICSKWEQSVIANEEDDSSNNTKDEDELPF